jgi:hypothetical protein
MSGLGSGGKLPPELADAVAKMVDVLTAADESVRQRAVAAVLRVAPPATLRLFIDSLINRLVRGTVAVERRAAASLAGLGPWSVSHLSCRLFKAQGSRQQVCLASALGQAALASPPAVRARARMDLLIALRRANNDEVAAAIGQVLRTLRNADTADATSAPRRPSTP